MTSGIKNLESTSRSVDSNSVRLPNARPAMRGRYLIRNPLIATIMTFIDACLSLLPHRKSSIPGNVNRILVANLGHMGDVVTTFGALQALRQRYPASRIDMIAGSWSKAAVLSCGLIDAVHIVDHWSLNRNALSKIAKLKRFFFTRAEALRAIKASNYDVALDFYPYFPPAHPIFFKVGIPARIGFSSGGFGPLLTHPVAWKNAARPISDYYRDILNVLFCENLVPTGALAPALANIASRPSPLTERYIVLHPGGGARVREWGADNWLTLTELLISAKDVAGLTLVVTGSGEREIAIAQEIADHYPVIVNMAGQATWEEFMGVVGHAALVICPDTVTGHLTALYSVPTITISTGTVDPAQWGPVNPNARILVHPTPCAPCYRPGCAAMACIANVTPLQVLDAARALLQGA